MCEIMSNKKCTNGLREAILRKQNFMKFTFIQLISYLFFIAIHMYGIKGKKIRISKYVEGGGRVTVL